MSTPAVRHALETATENELVNELGKRNPLGLLVIMAYEPRNSPNFEACGIMYRGGFHTVVGMHAAAGAILDRGVQRNADVHTRPNDCEDTP